MQSLDLRRELLLFGFIVGVLAFNSLYYGIWDAVWCSPDTVNYFRMAENIKSGFIMNPDGLAGRNGWFALWPVGYPLLLAGLSKVLSLDVYIASKILGCLIAGGVVVLFWFRFPTVRVFMALSLLNFAFLKLFRASWSEQVFLLGSVCFGSGVIDCIQHPSRNGFYRLSGGLLVMFFSRYVALTFLPIAMFSALLCAFRFGVGRRDFMLGTTCVCLCVIGYLVMNHFHSVTVVGTRLENTSSNVEIVRLFLLGVLRESQAFLLPFLFFVLVCLENGFRKVCRCWGRGGGAGAGVWIALGLYYWTVVLLLRFCTYFDGFGFRILYPGTFLIVIGLISGFADMSVSMKIGVNTSRTFCFAGIIVAFLGIGAFSPRIESFLRTGLTLDSVESRTYFGVKFALLKKYEAVAPGVVVYIQDYSQSDYMVNFLRPDLIVVPKQNRMYGEQY